MAIGDWFKDKETDLFAETAMEKQIREAQLQRAYEETQRRIDMTMAGSYTTNNSLQQAILGAAGAAGGGALGQPNPARGYSPIEKLLMRLNVRESSQSGFNYLAAVENSAKENVVVFLITKTGEALHVEDDRALFPTDGLVARLNILRG